MKRFLLFFLMFSSVTIGMETANISNLSQPNVPTESSTKLEVGFDKTKQSYELGKQILTILDAQRYGSTRSFPSDKLKVVKDLILKGANINVKTLQNGDSSLMIAIEIGDPELITLLLNNGANVKQKNNHGKTALHYVFYSLNLNNPDDIIKLLIKHGADINAQDQKGETPLMLATQFGKVDAVRLLTAGVMVAPDQRDLEKISKEAGTYLSLLPNELKKLTFENLIAKADPNIKNNKNETALDIARNQFKESNEQTPIAKERKDNIEQIARILEPITNK